MGKELKYHRVAMVRRLRSYAKKIQRIQEDLDTMIDIVYSTGNVEKAKQLAMIWHTLDMARDLFQKMEL